MKVKYCLFKKHLHALTCSNFEAASNQHRFALQSNYLVLEASWNLRSSQKLGAQFLSGALLAKSTGCQDGHENTYKTQSFWPPQTVQND